MNAQQASRLAGAPANVATWAQAVQWQNGEPMADPTLRLINDGEEGAAWRPAREEDKELAFGLRWEEARDIKRVVIRWAGTPPDPRDCRLHHWRWTVTKSFSSDEDWTSGHDWYQGDWKQFGGPPKVAGQVWTYEVAEPVRTLQLQLRVPARVPVAVTEFEVYTTSVWQVGAVEIEWGFAPGAANKIFDGRLEAYNGYVLSVQALGPGTTTTGPASWTSRGGKRGRRGVRATVLYTVNDLPDEPIVPGTLTTDTMPPAEHWGVSGGVANSDRTVISVLAGRTQTAFLPSDALRAPVYVPALGLFFCRAGQGLNAADFVKAWKAGRYQTIAQRAREAPEQSLARVRSDQRWSRSLPTIIRCNRDTTPFSFLYVSPDGEKIGGYGTGNWEIAPVVTVKPGPGAGRDRQWWLENHLPVLNTRWWAGDLAYQQELFGTTLEGGAPVIVMGLTATSWSYQSLEAEWDLSFTGWQADSGGVLRDQARRREIGGWIDLRGKGKMVASGADGQVSYQVSLGPGQSHTIWCIVPALCRTSDMETGRPASDLPLLKALVPESEREKVIAYWRGIVQNATRVDVPEPGMSDVWKQGIVQLLMLAEQRPDDSYDLRIGAIYETWESESAPVVQFLDMIGLHDIARKGLDFFLAGQGKAKPIGRFRTSEGCICTLAPYSCEGPGFVLQAMADHYEYTRNIRWLRKVAPNIKACCQWIIRERKLEMQATKEAFPGQQVWGHGLAPAGILGDPMDLRQMFFQNCYYCLGLLRSAEVLSGIDPRFSAYLAVEAEDYRKAIVRALDIGYARSPVVPLMNRAYGPFAPPFPHNRGLTRAVAQWGTWGGHVYDMEAGPLHVVDSRVVSPTDRRVEWMLDVLEDVICADGTTYAKKPGYNPQRDWPSFSGVAGQSNYQHMAVAYLKRDDIPNFLRVFYNCYAAHADRENGTFTENTGGGAPYKTHEQAWFMQQFRYLLVMEDGDELHLARGVPRAWLQDGRCLRVQNAQTFYGPVNYVIESCADNGAIRARVEMPARNVPAAVVLKLRHPYAKRMSAVMVNGKPWRHFDPRKETIRLTGVKGEVNIVARYGQARTATKRK